MQNQFKFTQSRLEAACCPSGKKRALFQDAARPELIVQVTDTGTKSYYCRCWNPAKGYTDKLYLGRVGHLSIEEARRRAREIAARSDRGEEPITRRRSIKRSITFEEAYDSFMREPAKRKKKAPRREATTNTYKKQYRRHLADRFGKKRLSAILRPEVDDFHSEVGGKNGEYAANRLVTMISGVFNDAISKGWVGANPATGIELFQERPRDRFLEEHEIGRFIASCESERALGASGFADVALLALFTGVRRRNACAASWDQFDLNRATWDLPANETKSGESHLVYLSEHIVELLASRFAHRSDDCWVFPGVGKTGHLVEPQRAVSKIARDAGIDPIGVNMHCLRHTFITYADDLGLPSAVRKRLASHKTRSDVTAGYTHARESRVREAYEAVARHMLSFVRET